MSWINEKFPCVSTRASSWTFELMVHMETAKQELTKYLQVAFFKRLFSFFKTPLVYRNRGKSASKDIHRHVVAASVWCRNKIGKSCTEVQTLLSHIWYTLVVATSHIHFNFDQIRSKRKLKVKNCLHAVKLNNYSRHLSSFISIINHFLHRTG